MTKDDKNRTTKRGEPGPAIEPADVIKCRECGGLVRRVNEGHLTSGRCRYTDVDNQEERTKRPDHPETVDDYKAKYPDAPVMSPREKAELSKRNRDPEVNERRRKMMRMRWRGKDMEKIVKRLADDYGVTENAIYSDWSKRDEWIGDVFGLEDADAAVRDALAQKKNVRDRLLKLATKAENQNELHQAISAMKKVDTNLDRTIEHLQNLGEVAKKQGEQTVRVEGEVTHTMPEGEDLDRDTLETLDSLTGGGEDDDVIDAEFREVEDDD